jgi:hypothetical protein
MRLLLTVTETFTIEGRGLVLLPELRFDGNERVSVGDPLLLRRPDNADETATVDAIELLKPVTGQCETVIMLKGRRKEDVPTGTEVWLL